MPPRKRGGVASPGTKAAAVRVGAAKGDHSKVDELFDSYRDKEEAEEVMGPEGIIQFCKDLGVDPSDSKTLLLAWKMGAKRQGFFSRAEFKTGFSSLGAATLPALKKALPALDAEVRDPGAFQQFYNYAFDFCLMEPGQKIIDAETAADMLAIVLPNGRFTKSFCDFLRQQTDYKKVNRDQWSLFLRFSREVRSDFGNYDDNPSWPLLLDNYVEWSKQQAAAAAAKATPMETDKPPRRGRGTSASPMSPMAASQPAVQKGRGRKRAAGQ